MQATPPRIRINPLTIVQIVAHASIVVMMVYAGPRHYLAAFAVYFFTGCIGMSMTYHRLLSHRSWAAPRGFEAFGTLCATLGLTGTSIGWVSVHRSHHAHVETEDDPHSPHFKGALWTQFRSMEYAPVLRNAKDLIASPFHRFLHRRYFGVQLAYVAILAATLGWFAVVYAYLFPAAILWNTGSLVNSVGHLWGYKNFPTRDQSRNNPLLAALTWGEGWHNNHHRYQKSAYFGYRWFEIDPAGILIKLLKRNRVVRRSETGLAATSTV